MEQEIRKNEDIEIQKISIKGIGIKDLIKEEVLEKFNDNFNEFTLINLSFIANENKPSNFISLGHISSEDYKNNVLTIDARNEKCLNKILDSLL